jgi:hypothetical protein
MRRLPITVLAESQCWPSHSAGRVTALAEVVHRFSTFSEICEIPLRKLAAVLS